MDWNVIQQYLPLYQKAAVLTVRLGVAGIFFAILIGLVCAVIQYEKVPVLRQLVSIYIQLSRNTPLLVQLFFLYYGLPKVGIKHQRRRLRHRRSGVSGRQLHGRGIPQRAGEHRAHPDRKRLQPGHEHRPRPCGYIILPQAMSTSMPAFMANVIFLLKETSVFSAISLMDLMFTAKDLIGMYSKTLECLFLLVVFYLIILLPVSIVGSLTRKEAALCRIWVLTSCSRAKT